MFQIIQILDVGISPLNMKEFSSAAEKLSSLSFAQFSVGNTNDIVVSFKAINAALLFVEGTLVDTTKLNLKKYASFKID